MFLQFFEGMMALFYLVGKCVVGWCSFVFNYFSQCYNFVMVQLYVSCIDMGYMYALSWKLLIIGLLLEYFVTLFKRLYLKKIAAKCSIFLHRLYFFLMGRSRIFSFGDKDQILSGEDKRKG